MPIVSQFNSADYQNSVRNILREFLLDYFPANTYVITDDPPTLEDLKKPTIWISALEATNLDELRTRRQGKSLQRKELIFAVSLLTNAKTPGPSGPANLIRQMAATFEHDAILRDGYKLDQAKIKQARLTPFVNVIDPSEAKYYRKYATLTIIVYVEAT